MSEKIIDAIATGATAGLAYYFGAVNQGSSYHVLSSSLTFGGGVAVLLALYAAGKHWWKNRR